MNDAFDVLLKLGYLGLAVLAIHVYLRRAAPRRDRRMPRRSPRRARPGCSSRRRCTR